jgi:protein tyrosine phosphatase
MSKKGTNMSHLKAFLQEAEHIRLRETKSAFLPVPDPDAYSHEVFTGVSLLERDNKLVLVIHEDNRPSDEKYEIDWPGTREDYEAMAEPFEFLPFSIPYLMVRVIRLLNENGTIPKEVNYERTNRKRGTSIPDSR